MRKLRKAIPSLLLASVAVMGSIGFAENQGETVLPMNLLRVEQKSVMGKERPVKIRTAVMEYQIEERAGERVLVKSVLGGKRGLGKVYISIEGDGYSDSFLGKSMGDRRIVEFDNLVVNFHKADDKGKISERLSAIDGVAKGKNGVVFRVADGINLSGVEIREVAGKTRVVVGERIKEKKAEEQPESQEVHIEELPVEEEMPVEIVFEMDMDDIVIENKGVGLGEEEDVAEDIVPVDIPEPAGVQKSGGVAEQEEAGVKYTAYSMTYERMLSEQTKRNAMTDSGGKWRKAVKSEIDRYLNIALVEKGSLAYLQFLDLAKTTGVDAVQLDQRVLKGKGILEGTGEAFVKAGSDYGVNEAYLVAHALLETGNGKSTLAKGTLVRRVGGKAVEPKIVYNMYGIGAVDSNPLQGGAEFAYREGWFTPKDAVIGGAKFVRQRYIDQGQNTIYEMRWNPDINKIWKQYATDIGWAHKQVKTIDQIYKELDGYTLSYDIPVYRGE